MINQIQAVAFDAFGTLVRVTNNQRSFHQVAELLRSDSSCFPMTSQVDFQSWAKASGINDEQLLAELMNALELEINSIELYPEVKSVLAQLRASGLRLALASNVTYSFATALRRLLKDKVDLLHLSCELGSAKPSSSFYQALCSRLEYPPQNILMVGDTLSDDYAGAKDAGLNAVLLNRNATRQPLHCGDTTFISSLNQLFNFLY